MPNTRKQRVTAILGVVIPMIFLTGCAADLGRSGISNAALVGDTEAMWKDGQQAVERGEALISQGNSKVAQSRQDYQAAAVISGASSNPKEIEFEAKRLRAIGDRWQDAIDEIKEGNQLISKGTSEISAAQSEVREGRALVESGSTLMRNAQRKRLGVKPLPSAPQSS